MWCSFYRDREFFASLRVTYRPSTRCPELARRLWGRNADGATWECLFFLDSPRRVTIKYHDLWERVRVGPSNLLRGLTVIVEPLSDRILSHFGLLPPDG